MAKLGNLWFDLGLDTRQLDKAWGEAMKKYQAQGKFDTNLGSKKTLDGINAQNSALGTQHRLMQNLHTLAASYVSIFAAGRLVRELITISGEFEMQRVSLQAILKDLEGANKIFDQIKQLAVKSPFQFKDLVSYTKQLSAFSIPMNELYDTTKMLSDVSAGLGVGMDRLVLAYGQIRAASVLRGQEVRQLTEAGIPVIEELRKKFEELGETGITAADVFDKISARLVPFSMIKEMFEDMTSEGGKFYKMQEIQAETLKGKVSNLKDAYQIMFSEIGEKGDKVLKGAVDVIRSMIENYEEVGKTVLELVAAYGVYRGALIANNAILAIQTKYGLYDIATKKLQLAATLKNITAQKTLNAVMAINPYVAAAAAIAALSFGLYKIITQTTDYEKALNKLTEAKEKAQAEYISEEYELSKLYDRLKTATKGTKDYQDAKDAIQRKYGSYLNGLRNERGEVVELADAYELLVDKIRESAFERGYQAYIDEATTEYSKTLSEQIVKMDRAIQSAIKKNIMSTREGALLSGELNAVLKGEKQLHELSKEAKSLYTTLANVSNGSVQYAVAQTSIARTNIKRLSEEAKRLFSTQTFGDGGEYPPKPSWMSGDKWLKDLGNYAKQYNTALQSAIMPKDDESTKDYLSRLRDDYAKTSKSIAVNSQFAGKNVDALQERLRVLSGAFKVLGISPIEAKEGEVKLKKEQRDYRADLIELEKKLALDLAKARIDGMVEGFDKEMAQMDYEHQRRIEQIERQKRDLLEMQKKAGGSGEQLTPENAAMIVGLTNESQMKYDKDVTDFYAKGLSKYEGFNRKKKNIEEKYLQDSIDLNNLYSEMSQEDYEAAMKNLSDAREKELKALEDDMLNTAMNTSSLLVRIFGDIDRMTRRQLKKNIADAKTILNYISNKGVGILPEGVTPEQLKDMVGSYEAIVRLQKVIMKMEKESRDYGDTPILSNAAKLVDTISKYRKAVAEAKKEGKELSKEDRDAFGKDTMAVALAVAIELSDAFGRLADRMAEVAEATGNMKLKELAAEMKDVSGFFSDVGKGAQQGGWIGAVIAAVFSAVTKTIDAFQQAKLQDAIYKKEQLDWAREYQDMMLRLSNNDYESIFGVRVLEKSIDAYKNAVRALRNYDDELNKRTAPTIEKERKATGIATFFGFGGGMNATVTRDSQLALDAYKKGYSDIQRMAIKTKDQSGWANFFGAKDEFKTLFDIAPEIWGKELGGEFDVNAAKVFLETNTQITEEQRKQIQNLITQKELYDENVNIIKEDLKDTFGGMGDAMVDSIVRGMTEGADSWSLFEDAGDQAIERLGEKLMYEVFFAKRFEKYAEELMAVYDDKSGLSPEEIANKQIEITDKYMDYLQSDQKNAQDWAESYREAARAKGFDIWDSADSNSLGKSIQAAQMTENTANLIASYINAIRADGSKKAMMIEKITPMVGNINDTLSNSLTHLAAINSNTLRSANGVDRLVEKIDALTTPNGATRLNTVVRTS